MESICYICQQSRDLVQTCPNCTTWAHKTCFSNQADLTKMQCGICKRQLIRVHRKRFNTEKFIKDRVKELNVLYQILTILLSMMTIIFSAVGRSISNPDVNKNDITLTFVFIFPFLSLYFVSERIKVNVLNFIKSSKIQIITIPALLFFNIMSVHIIGYFFVNEFFTHKTFLVGCVIIWACLTTGFVCFIGIREFMNLYESFIDFYSDTVLSIEHVE